MIKNRTVGNPIIQDLWTRKDGTPTSRHGKGKRWSVRWNEANGKQLSRSFNRKIDAKNFASAITAQVDRGDYRDKAAGQLLVREVFTEWEPTTVNNKQKTRDDRMSLWRVHVEPYWAEWKISNIRKTDVSKWIATMSSEKVGNRTIQRAVGVLRGTLQYAVDAEMIAVNPAVGVQLPKTIVRRRNYLSIKQVEKLAQEMLEPPEELGLGEAEKAVYAAFHSQYPTVIRVLAYTGIRWAEMSALRVDSIDFDTRRFDIHRTDEHDGGKYKDGTPKNHKRRTVPFPSTLAPELRNLTKDKAPGDRVFQSDRGKMLRGSNFRRRQYVPALDRIRKNEPTFPLLTIHDLRHTAASIAIQAGANVKAVQRMLGHASAKMTLDTYAELFDSDLDRVGSEIDALIRRNAA